MNKLLPVHRALVQRSFRYIAANHQLISENFFKRMFELDTSLPDLFSEGISHQHHKFMYMLALIISTLDNPEDLTSIAGKLGKRHFDYGVKRHHYDIGREALLYALQQHLGDRFTPAIQVSWECFLDDFIELACDHLYDAGEACVE